MFRNRRLSLVVRRIAVYAGLAWVLALASAWGAPELTAARTGTPPHSSWPMFRGDPQQTGVAHSSLPDKLAVRWKAELKEPVASTAAIVDGVVYLGADDNALHALDLSTGAVLWQYAAKEAIRSSPTVVDGVAFFGDQEGVFHAVDTRTRQAKWTFKTEGEVISSANHDGGRIVFGSYDAFVYCLSADEGHLLWKFETGGRVHGSPGITDGHVIVAGCDEHLHVLKLSDGQEVTRVSMGSVSGASAAIVDSRVFVGTYGHQFHAIDWKASQVLWTYEDPDRQFPILSSAAVTGRTVIAGGRDKRLRALDPKTG